MFKVAPKGAALHADEMLKYTVPEAGWPVTIQAAKAVALTAYDLLKNPAKVKEI
jgi:hypothetical protein